MPRQDEDEPPASLAVRLIVAAVAAGALVPAALGAAHSADAGAHFAIGYHHRPGRDVERMEYLGAEMARRIPAGTRVFVDEPDELWRFRMTELVTVHGLVLAVDTPGADLVLRRRSDASVPHGVALDIAPAAT
ncbi:hypothetical protein [Dactylosporangium sp. CA-233914]|uniref:hypothetical protein n=1 Tax=Dactylosporangium sp. CA-233914 TaxID=3239934 RepID=UPI003D92C52D